MHSTDLKHEFVTLRARGLALGKIAEQLNVPKSTLGRWLAECEEEVQQLQRIEWEEIEEQYGYTLQDDLKRIMKRLRAAEDQLDARSLERFSRRELFQLIRESRREYEKKRALLLGTPKRDKMVRPPATAATVSLEGGAPRREPAEGYLLPPGEGTDEGRTGFSSSADSTGQSDIQNHQSENRLQT